MRHLPVPEGVQIHIFGYLGFKDLLSAACVNTRWDVTTSQEVLWDRLLRMLWEGSASPSLNARQRRKYRKYRKLHFIRAITANTQWLSTKPNLQMSFHSVPSSHPIHNGHPQLWDTICCPEDENSFVYASGDGKVVQAFLTKSCGYDCLTSTDDGETSYCSCENDSSSQTLADFSSHPSAGRTIKSTPRSFDCQQQGIGNEKTRSSKEGAGSPGETSSIELHSRASSIECRGENGLPHQVFIEAIQAPLTINCSRNFVAAAMLRGEFAIASTIHPNDCHKHRLNQIVNLQTFSIVNYVHIFELPNQILRGLPPMPNSAPHHRSMWVVNNDGIIRGYALPNLDVLCRISLPTSLNCVSIRPDGNIILSAGDSGEVFLHYTENFSPVQTTNRECDRIQLHTLDGKGAFSCAWHPQAEQFAVSSSEGHVTVWSWDLKSSGNATTLAAAPPVCIAQLDAGFGVEKLVTQTNMATLLNLQTNRYGVVKYAEYPCNLIFWTSGYKWSVADTSKFERRQTYNALMDYVTHFGEREAIESEFGDNRHIFGFAMSPNTMKIFVSVKPCHHMGGIMTYQCRS